MSVYFTLRGCECFCNSHATFFCVLSRPYSAVFHLPLCACSTSPSVPPNSFSPASSWQYLASMARSRWAQTVKLPTQTATCSAFVWRCRSTSLHPSLTWCMFVLRIGRLALPSRHLSDDMLVYFIRSFFAVQRSSDTRSCSGRSSCARPQRSRASSPRG